jgi:NADH-quinone oxidoreductase subunit K
MVPTSLYLILSLVLFLIGVSGVVLRRNAIVVFMCIELMLNAVNISFVALSRHQANLNGQVGVFFVMVVAAAEAAVGLALIISLFRAYKDVDSRDAGILKY